MRIRPSARIMRWTLVGPPLFALIVVGGFWFADRIRSWDEPGWNADHFVVLREREESRLDEFWVVPVNPDCPHCSEHLARVVERRPRHSSVHALVVDQPRRPADDVFAEVDVDAAWWDSAGTWRHRWGHRLYGEAMVFDARGRLLRTEAPGRDPPPQRADRGLGVPPDDH